jgi:hypothetical protein
MLVGNPSAATMAIAHGAMVATSRSKSASVQPRKRPAHRRPPGRRPSIDAELHQALSPCIAVVVEQSEAVRYDQS